MCKWTYHVNTIYATLSDTVIWLNENQPDWDVVSMHPRQNTDYPAVVVHRVDVVWRKKREEPVQEKDDTKETRSRLGWALRHLVDAVAGEQRCPYVLAKEFGEPTAQAIRHADRILREEYDDEED